MRDATRLHAAGPGTHDCALMPQNQRPTIYDVARVAGVSHQTVSRVLNADGGVRPTTRARVEQAVGMLGYRRRAAARALASGSVRTVAVVSAGGATHGPAATLLGISRAAAEEGITVLTALLDGEGDQTKRLRVVLEELAGHQPVALISVVDDRLLVGALLDFARREQMPVVITGGDEVGENCSSVALDQSQGAIDAVGTLIAGGSRNLAVVRGPSASRDAEKRLASVEREAARLGARVTVLDVTGWTAETGRRSAQSIVAGGHDAVLAANDQVALGVLRGLHEAGRRVPDDVQVAGFDDIPEAQHLITPLTTVHLDFELQGAHAVREGLRLAAGRSGRHVKIPTQVIERRTTIVQPHNR